MQVNNGAPFAVAAAASPTWAPPSPTSGGPTWSNNVAGQNVLAPGQNYVQITPSGETVPYAFSMTLPRNLQWTSLQIYVFFNSYSDVSWIVLNNGQYVVGNFSLASSQLIDTPA